MKKSILLLPLMILASALAACSSPAGVPATPATRASSAATTASSAPASGAGATCTYEATADAAKKVNLPPTSGVANSGTATVTLKLNDKALAVTLDQQRTPCTTNSFLSLVSQKYFDGTSCHRLADSGIFVLQCGDPTGTGTGGPGYQYADELTGDETYPAGTLAMANAGAGTNGSQFFIVFADTTLAPNYTVFGAIDAAGLKIVKAIAAGGQDGTWGDGTGKPKLPAVITSATVG
ncbi:MAG TPA: peptidylprolyl isomerase [Propionicimonas sp.]|uniref:peptidylprolyl isomerase n=1 Tax=Propionicimonas sp. TaxID=1955623 RepID=UPI002F41186B